LVHDPHGAHEAQLFWFAAKFYNNMNIKQIGK